MHFEEDIIRRWFGMSRTRFLVNVALAAAIGCAAAVTYVIASRPSSPELAVTDAPPKSQESKEADVVDAEADEKATDTAPTPLSKSQIASIAMRAAKGFTAAMQEGGMTGLRISIQDCYQRAQELRTLNSAVYCIMLDYLTVTRDYYVSQKLGYAQEESDTRSSSARRAAEALDFINYDIPDESSEVTDWIDLASRNAAALVCVRLESIHKLSKANLRELGCSGKLDEQVLQSALDMDAELGMQAAENREETAPQSAASQ